MAATNIKIERYKNPANVDGWDGYVEPEDLTWILYFGANGRTKFYPERDRFTGAVIEPEAPTQHFVVWRHADKTGVSGTGLVAYGWDRTDGRALVRWLGEHRTETLHEGGMESVDAIHGHGGATSILMCGAYGAEHSMDRPEQIVLPRVALPTVAFEGEHIYLTRDPRRGWIVGLGAPARTWAVVKSPPAECWATDALMDPDDALVHGDKIEGVSVDDVPRMFYETTGGVLLSSRPLSTGNALETWASEPGNRRVSREFEWHEVVEILAAGFEKVIVTRLTPDCGGDPAYHWIPV